MAEIVRFKCEHMKDLLDEETQSYFGREMKPEDFKHLESAPFAFSVIHNGKILATMGIFVYWQGRGEAWAFAAKGMTENFVAVHKAAKNLLDSLPVKRIEGAVRCNFRQGHRWARMLGFKLEASCLHSYFPDGSDCTMYAYVKDGEM